MDQETNLNNQIEQMKEFVKKRDDCKGKEHFTNSTMSMCLRASDYDIEKAYNLGLKYFERFESKKISIESKAKLMHALNSSVIRVCCNKGLKDETIIVFDLLNSKEIDEELIPCTISIVLDYLLRDVLFQLNGCFILFDMANLKLKHLSSIRKKLIKKIFLAFEFSVPIKINKLFIICTDKFGQIVFLKYIKKCISKELRDKMIIYKKNEYTKLEEFIDLNYLAEKYEGRMKEMKFLDLPLLIDEALEHMPGYSFGNVTRYYSFLSNNSEEDSEKINESSPSKCSESVSGASGKSKAKSESKLDASASSSD